MAKGIRAITMPKWGMEMAEGVINEWLVAIGDSINPGDDLVDVETSKIVNTVTAEDGGTLRAILAQAGATFEVGATLGVLADADIADADIQAFIADQSGASVAAATIATTQPQPAAATQAQITPQPVLATAAPIATAPVDHALAELAEGADDSTVAASPVARRLARYYGVNLHKLQGSGRHGRVSKRDLEAAVSAAGGRLIATVATSNSHPAHPSHRYGDDSDIKSTPVARRRAAELGVNLHECRASGERGRVCKADVEAVAALKARTPAAPADTAPIPSQTQNQAEQESFKLKAMSGMRKTIAARLQSSKQNAPHFRVQIDAELDNLLELRQQIKAAGGHKISVNDCIVKACASALLKVPAVNVQFDGEQLKYFNTADIAVAVATDEGLITPIVRQANSKGLVALSTELRDLASRARLNQLKGWEFQGGSFCISNLGMYGVSQFDAIINPPQGAILAVGAGQQRPVVKDGQLTVATVITLTLSSDHRIIDGADAAEFIAVLKGFLEQPATMLS